MISIFSLTQLFISNLPGSEIVGVPASEIKEIIFLFFKSLIIFSKTFFSLNLWYAKSFLLIL